MGVELKQLVDPDRGLISPRLFADEEIYERELRAIFDRSWLFLAHESQLAKPGDFFTAYMGENPVVVVRQRDGSLKALLNSCRHRGMRVCRADGGNARSFMCSYHGWTYNQAGELVSVPNREQYGDMLDTSEWGLVEVAQLDTYKGLIFATWDPSAPPLLEALGDMAWYLDAMFDRLPGGSEAIGGVHKWRLRGNWKLAAEQFTSDMYHLAITHMSALIALMPEDAEPVALPSDGRQLASPLGHGTGFFFEAPAADHNPTVKKYLEEVRPEMEAHLGAARVRGPLMGHANLFPNMGFLPGSGTLRVWNPKGPHEIEVWAWTIVDAAAPAHIKDEMRRMTLQMFSPTGMLEQDDAENWAECARNARATQVQAHPWNYQMGLEGDRGADPEYPGDIGFVLNEAAARSFYRRYLELMENSR